MIVRNYEHMSAPLAADDCIPSTAMLCCEFVQVSCVLVTNKSLCLPKALNKAQPIRHSDSAQ